MEDKSHLAKIFFNKKNNQAMVHLSRKKLKILKERKVKFLRIREEDLI